MERRAIIEEAAGVTKFKTKKRLAEAKLESSKVNLSRVNDIVVEVEKQLGSLKRQAAKARRYSEIRDQMRGIVRQMLAGKARELDAEAERTTKQLEELTAAELQRATTIQQQEGEQDRLNQRIYELDAEIRQNQNVLNLTALEVDRSEIASRSTGSAPRSWPAVMPRLTRNWRKPARRPLNGNRGALRRFSRLHCCAENRAF